MGLTRHARTRHQMDPCWCKNFRPADLAAELLAEARRLAPCFKFLRGRICSHLVAELDTALRAAGAVAEARVLQDLVAPGCKPLQDALEAFLEDHADVESFAKRLHSIFWYSPMKVLGVLERGPWRQYLAPDPDLGHALRACGRDARVLLRKALFVEDLALARTLMDGGVDPTLCVCDPYTWKVGAHTYRACHCNLLDALFTHYQMKEPAFRELLRRGCRPKEGPVRGLQGLSLIGELACRTFRAPELEALLETPGVDTTVLTFWGEDVTRQPLRDFVRVHGAAWAVELVELAGRWTDLRRAWIASVLRAPRRLPGSFF